MKRSSEEESHGVIGLSRMDHNHFLSTERNIVATTSGNTNQAVVSIGVEPVTISRIKTVSHWSLMVSIPLILSKESMPTATFWRPSLVLQKMLNTSSTCSLEGESETTIWYRKRIQQAVTRFK